MTNSPPLAAPSDDNRGKSVSRTATIVSFSIAALGFAAALVWTCSQRGPWYDEFYTWYVTGPERTFGAALRDSWLADNHPPLFYILAWLGRRFATTIEQLRLLNLAGFLSVLIAGWLIVRRQGQLVIIGTVMTMLLIANQPALQSGAEIRSYFLSYSLSAVVVLGLVAVWLDGHFADRAAAAAWSVAITVAFNLHILTSVILACLVLPFVAAALLTRQSVAFRQLVIPTLLAGTIFSLICLFQLSRWESNTANFWIPGGFNAAFLSLYYAIVRAAETNPVLLAGGLIGTASMIWACWRARHLSREAQATLLIGLGIAIAAVVLIGLHLIRPMVMERYVAALIPAVAAGIALGFAQAMRMVPPRWAGLTLMIAVAVSLYAMVGHARTMAVRNSWQGTAGLAAKLQQQCPDSPVHTAPEIWNAYTMSLPPVDNKAVFGDAHRMMAARNGIRIEPASSRRISARCPTLFWAEHDTSRIWHEPEITAKLRGQGFPIKQVWQYRIGDGWIASDQPLPGLAPAS